MEGLNEGELEGQDDGRMEGRKDGGQRDASGGGMWSKKERTKESERSVCWMEECQWL